MAALSTSLENSGKTLSYSAGSLGSFGTMLNSVSFYDNSDLKKSEALALDNEVVLHNTTDLSSFSSRNCKFLPQLPLDKYRLNEDPNPEIIRKKPIDKLIYRQQLAFKFLEPPQPPKPGDIVIKQLPNRQIAPAPPLIVRQTPPKPSTPAPLVLREEPPKPPSKIEEQVIVVPGKVIPPPARKVVVEKLPAIPPKPQHIYLEKWLPFKRQKRTVKFQKAEPHCVIPNPKNLVIEWESPEVKIKRELKHLGVEDADPEEYIRKYKKEILKHKEFVKAAANIGAPEDVLTSDSHRELELPELVGDVEALKLIDLNKVGLSEYSDYLKVSKHSSSISTAGYSLNPNSLSFGSQFELDSLLTFEEAKYIMNNLSGANQKPFTEEELKAYFNSIDTDSDGVISYNELINAFQEQ